MHENIEMLFKTVLRFGITGVEVIGALIVFVYTFHALVLLLKKQTHQCRNKLMEGISTGLSFLLGSEVLNTIIAPDWSAVGMTCAVLLMRAGMTLLLHWEQSHGEESR